MTERLSELLRVEAETIEIPAPPARDVIGQGQSLRRRRRTMTLVAAAAAIGIIGGGAAVTLDRAGDSHVVDGSQVSASDRYLRGGAYAVGSKVFFGDPENGAVTLEEKVKALYYTADGLLVRTGKTPWTDDPGPSHYSMVTPTGQVQRLDIDLGDRVPGTDPTTSTLVYADGSQGSWEIVVRDLGSDREAKRIPVEGSFTWGGWEAPPVALVGDTAYVGFDDATVAVDLTDGSTTKVDSLPGATMPEANGGHVIVTDRKSNLDVNDLATGETVLHVDLPRGHSYGELSPDGRYLKVVQEESIDANGEYQVQKPGFDVYDIETGEHVTFDQADWDFGWTPRGQLIKVTHKDVVLCDPDTGGCDSEQQSSGPGEIKIAGNSYES